MFVKKAVKSQLKRSSVNIAESLITNVMTVTLKMPFAINAVCLAIYAQFAPPNRSLIKSTTIKTRGGYINYRKIVTIVTKLP